ncbi:MAG: hypothetical protein HYX85_00315 [Chloroflexi bacterium]|nr:hypothetical protein [Chloroflexota bacterium]
MEHIHIINPAFTTGQIVLTRGVYDLTVENDNFARFVQDSLNRHVKGDWGDPVSSTGQVVDDEDKATNEKALKQGTRLLSAYSPREGGDDRFPQNGVATIWIITEADRSATTILFPDEY